MPEKKNEIISGSFEKPAGEYSISLQDEFVRVVSGETNFELPSNIIKAVVCGWAVPAKGGGYVFLSFLLKDNSEQHLFMSEGYSDDLLDRYLQLGKRLAAKMSVPFKEAPLGADA
jgi:hypothetical protein